MVEASGAETMTGFTQELEAIAGKASELLDRLPSGGSVTAWDMKLRLKIALSPLYMALGLLQERGRIRIVPDGLTYRVHPAGATRPAKPVVGIPIEIPAPAGEQAASKVS